MKYTLNVKETGNKAAKFHYTVTDENGTVISTRSSNREYVACTICGSFYFGRLDLIGKGDHGNYLKMCAGYARDYNQGKWNWVKGSWGKNEAGKDVLIPGPGHVTEPVAIAYKQI